jgi:hypothetical protein
LVANSETAFLFNILWLFFTEHCIVDDITFTRNRKDATRTGLMGPMTIWINASFHMVVFNSSFVVVRIAMIIRWTKMEKNTSAR